jgi:hypothetical protein
VNTFGGTVVYPADVSYRAVALTANVTLTWPTELATNSNVVSSIMDVTPSGAGFTIRMPDATQASVGQTALFFNVGASSFTVADNSGNTIQTIASGQAWQIYLTDNTTVNGTWRPIQYGTGTSSASASALAGAGLKAITTTLNQSAPTTLLSADYTLTSVDRARVIVWNGGAGTFTMPSASTAGNDWFFDARNSGTGGLTIQPAGGELINGQANLVFNPGDSARIITDGISFYTIGYGQSSTFSFDYVSISLTGETSPYTLSGTNLNRIAYQFSGILTANMEIIVPNTIQQYWVRNTTTGSYSLTVKTAAGTGVSVVQNGAAIMYCDGTNVVEADTNNVSSPIAVSQGGTGATSAGAALVNLGGTSLGIGVFTAVNAAVARASLGAAASGANADITSLSGLTTPISVLQGGTGQTTYTNGQLLIGNTTGNTLVKSTLTAGTGISITNGTGSITIAGTGPDTFPGVGIAYSTGTAWGTSYTTSGTGTTIALTVSPALTGTPTAPTATAGTNTTQIATTAYVVGTAFSAALPGQSGNTGKFVTTDGTSASWSFVPLATGVSGTLPVANGGTGAVTLTGVVKGNGTSAFTAGTVSLTSEISGILPPANGGTGLSSPGTAGNVLTSDGTVWVSQLPAAGGITYTTVKTSNFTAAANDGVQTDTSGGAFTVTLPATPAVGDQVFVTDSAGSWATNNLTVGRNGSTIDGLSEDLICNISSVSVQFVYSGTTWDVFAQVGGAAAGVVSVAGGGTGVSTLTGYVKGSGTSPLTASATIPVGDLSGTLGVANGGTGLSSPGTSGNVLTSDGTNWTSTALPSSAVQYPQNIQSADYTLVLGDAGKQIFHPVSDTTVRTYTIPANSSVAFPIGTVVLFTVENGGVTVKVSITSDTLVFGNGTTGSLFVPVNNTLMAIKVTATKWMANYLYQTGAPSVSEAVAVSSTGTPYIQAYPWSAVGFGTKYSDPGTLPAGNGNGVAFTANGDAIAVAHNTTPFISAYPFSSAGYGTKYSDPGTLPASTGNEVAFSPIADAIAVAHATTPFVSAYPWNSSTGFGTKYSDPGTLPASTGNGVAFSPGGNAIAVAHNTTPYVSAYPWNVSTGFGTKYTNPATLPTGAGNGVTFSPAGDAIAVAHTTTPFISAYPWNSGTGFGTKYTNPATLPTGTGNGVAFSPAGDAIAVAHTSSPLITAYPWSGAGFGAKYADPATLPSGVANGVAFNTGGNALAVAHATTPFVSAYPWNTSTGFGVKYANPATLPGTAGLGVDFTSF